MATDILIIDDEPDIRELVAGILEDEGHGARTARDSEEALAAVAQRRPSLVFLDIWLQGSRLDGLQLLDVIKAEHPDLPVVMISGHGNIETAVSAIKRGAYDYIEKPFKADRLVLVAERALEASRLKREVKDLRQRTGEGARLVGASSVMNHLRQLIQRVGPTNSRIMISGPSGSEAQPGQPRRIGALEEAHGGTLFIDEVADMPRETQNKILRVLVDQAFQRVGGAMRVHVDVRIISSTSRDLEKEVSEGRFREDLFHRLSVVPIRVPALAERREDVPELVRHFIEQIAQATGLPPRRIGTDAMAVLQAHDWPGNVRQLRNNVERLMILANGDAEAPISADMLPPEVGANMPPMPTNSNGVHLMALPLRDAREIFEREYLTAQINRFGGNISRRPRRGHLAGP